LNQKGIDDIDLSVYLLDDGSTDGTSDAVKQKYPIVKILHGDGTLFWNGGMRVAFAEAMKSNYDYYFWLNDDTFLYYDSLKRMLDLSKDLHQKELKDAIVTGSIVDSELNETNYGGRRQKDNLHRLVFLLVGESKEPQICDTFNGNAVLIPKAIPKEIGNISKEFSKQHNGDFDYGLRAKYAGFETWVTPGIIGECSSNSADGTIHDKSLSLKDRIKQMKSPKGVSPAKEWMIFTKRHGGFLWPYYWFRTIIRVVFPFTYLFVRTNNNH
jgi:GT2 family glycosyltransferase